MHTNKQTHKPTKLGADSSWVWLWTFRLALYVRTFDIEILVPDTTVWMGTNRK